jgi:uncharacterized membrane protein YphA (DoxX/SURF4 family)
MQTVFLRIALAITMLSAVADRFGFWGASSTWGNWENFVAYTKTLTFFLPDFLVGIAAVIATVAEIVLPVFLLIGFKLKHTAFATGCLLLGFALSMTFSVGLKSSLDYSVWVGSAAAFVLSDVKDYRFSLDALLNSKRNDLA